MVNATNFHLAGKEGVSGVIHRAAGYEELQAECKKVSGGLLNFRK